MIGGDSDKYSLLNDVWTSPDGNSWNQLEDASFSRRRFHSTVSHEGLIYVIGGFNGN